MNAAQPVFTPRKLQPVGSFMTASDVAFSLKKAIEVGTSTKFSGYLNDVEVTGEYTVRMTLKNPVLGSIEYCLSQIPIVTQAAFESQTDNERATQPITTGPYRVEEFVSGSYITLVRNDNYWQTDDSLKSYQAAANAKKVTLKVTTENSQRSIALETGSADIASSIAVSDLGQFMAEDGSSKAGYTVEPVLSGTTVVLEFNCSTDSVFNNKALRQAALYAIDTPSIMQAEVGVRGLSTKSFASQAVSDYDPAWNDEDYYDYDPAKAAEKLAESGVDMNGKVVKIMCQSEHSTACQVIQAFLMQIGIQSQIVAYDSALFNTNMYVSTEWDIMVNTYGFTDYTIDGWSLRLNRNGFASGSNGQFVNDDHLQELVEAASSLDTHSQETVNAVHEYVAENAFCVGLYTPYQYIVANDSVSKIVHHPWGQVIAGSCEFVK